MSNTNNMSSDRSEGSSSGRDSIASRPVLHYHNPFLQAELRSLVSYPGSDSSDSTLLEENTSNLDNGRTPNHSSNTSEEENSIKDEDGEEHAIDSTEEQAHRPDLKPKHETIEQRAERLNDEIRTQTATVQTMDQHAENWKREIARLRALCEEHGKSKYEAMAKIAGLEAKKRWVDTILQLVETESPSEAFRVFLAFYIRNPRTLGEVCGLMSVVAMVMFWKFWQLRA